jgi:L-cysteine desulfidase
MGAAAGTALVLGMDEPGTLAPLKNMAGNMTGEICDGAKLGCAVKLCTAAGAAIQSALLARQSVSIPASNGILALTAREIFENVGQLARAMKELDRNIVELMERKQTRGVA